MPSCGPPCQFTQEDGTELISTRSSEGDDEGDGEEDVTLEMESMTPSAPTAINCIARTSPRGRWAS